MLDQSRSLIEVEIKAKPWSLKWLVGTNTSSTEWLHFHPDKNFFFFLAHVPAMSCAMCRFALASFRFFVSHKRRTSRYEIRDKLPLRPHIWNFAGLQNEQLHLCCNCRMERIALESDFHFFLCRQKFIVRRKCQTIPSRKSSSASCLTQATYLGEVRSQNVTIGFNHSWIPQNEFIVRCDTNGDFRDDEAWVKQSDLLIMVPMKNFIDAYGRLAMRTNFPDGEKNN